MSKLDDICYHLYEASSQNPSKYVRAEWSGKPYSPDEARQQIKNLILELMAEVLTETEGIFALFEPHLKKKVEEL